MRSFRSEQAMDSGPSSLPTRRSVRVGAKGIGRALLLRCPHCGDGRVIRSWFSLREACPECGLRFERDEADDYWLGAYLLNFIVTEVVFAVMLGAVLIATWPDPPWSMVIWLGVLQMCVTPILFYPFAKALWLATDLVFRPLKPEDFTKTSLKGS